MVGCRAVRRGGRAAGGGGGLAAGRAGPRRGIRGRPLVGVPLASGGCAGARGRGRGRGSLLRAAGLGVAGAVAGTFAHVGGAEEQTPAEPFLPVIGLRPAAALSAAACLIAAGLCLVLSGRRVSWLPPADSGSGRRRVRRVSFAAAWGAVGGIVPATATGHGALEPRGGPAGGTCPPSAPPPGPFPRASGTKASRRRTRNTTARTPYGEPAVRHRPPRLLKGGPTAECRLGPRPAGGRTPAAPPGSRCPSPP